MLDAVRSPLTRSHITESCLALVEQLIDNPILGAVLKILKGVLQKRVIESEPVLQTVHFIGTWTTREPVSWHARLAHFPFSDLLTLDKIILIRCGGNMLFKTYYSKIGGAGGVQVNSIIYRLFMT